MYRMPGAGIGVTGGGAGALAATGAGPGWWFAICAFVAVLSGLALIAVILRKRRLSRARD